LATCTTTRADCLVVPPGDYHSEGSRLLPPLCIGLDAPMGQWLLGHELLLARTMPTISEIAMAPNRWRAVSRNLAPCAALRQV